MSLLFFLEEEGEEGELLEVLLGEAEGMWMVIDVLSE